MFVDVRVEVDVEPDAHFTWLPRLLYQCRVFDSDTATPKIGVIILQSRTLARSGRQPGKRSMVAGYDVCF
jgi:hypothetical protein